MTKFIFKSYKFVGVPSYLATKYNEKFADMVNKHKIT